MEHSVHARYRAAELITKFIIRTLQTTRNDEGAPINSKAPKYGGSVKGAAAVWNAEAAHQRGKGCAEVRLETCSSHRCKGDPMGGKADARVRRGLIGGTQ